MPQPAEVEGLPLPIPARWTEDGTAVLILDQSALPERERWLVLETVEDAHEAIRSLRVRGAPLVGITAALAVAALAARALGEDEGIASAELAERVRAWCARLATARPTAVNLSWAMGRMALALAGGPRPASQGGATDAAQLVRRLVAEAGRILAEDRETCRSIGEHALALLPAGARVLTHCNAGALATGGIGTALAPVYLAHLSGRPVRVFVGETRPLLQGSRLTAWELLRAGVDVTLLADDMAGALFARERPDLVLVGADRIAANGDVANKIGTYALAVLARHHGVPFYVLAPTSTVDLATPSGAEIPIELRSGEELRRGFGPLTAPAEVAVWNPAFDVTPAELLSGIVTEWGVARRPFAPALEDAVERAHRRRQEGAAP